MNSPYRTVTLDFPVTTTGFTDPKLAIPRGNPIIAVTVLTLPAAAVNASNIGYLFLIIGDGDPIRINQQGVTWFAQRGADNQPLVENGGVTVRAGDTLSGAHPAILGVELYVELLGGKEQ